MLHWSSSPGYLAEETENASDKSAEVHKSQLIPQNRFYAESNVIQFSLNFYFPSSLVGCFPFFKVNTSSFNRSNQELDQPNKQVIKEKKGTSLEKGM